MTLSLFLPAERTSLDLFTSPLNIIYKKCDWGKKAIKCKQKFHVCSMFILFYLTNLVQFKKWEKTEKDKNKKRVGKDACACRKTIENLFRT